MKRIDIMYLDGSIIDYQNVITVSTDKNIADFLVVKCDYGVEVQLNYIPIKNIERFVLTCDKEEKKPRRNTRRKYNEE